MHYYYILYRLFHMRATGALQDSGAAPSSACVIVDDGGSGPLPLLAVLADGFGAPKSCPPSATCTWLMLDRLLGELFLRCSLQLRTAFDRKGLQS
jgi:hypothetical protein